MIKGFLFDFGGTLDTAGCHWGQMLWHAYQHQGVPVSEEHFREAYVYTERLLGRSPLIKPDTTFYKMLDIKIRIEMEHLCTSGQWDADEETLITKHNAVLKHLYSQVVSTTSYSRGVLVRLKEKYNMVLVTNFYGNMHEVLKEFNLADMFDNVVESAVVGLRKPDVKIINMGVNALGLKPEETIMVGDSFYKDIEPAKAAGCKTAWFKGEGWTDKTYDETIPDYIITDLAQLLDI